MSLYSSDRPEFAERVARLAGQTTYRVPTEGRGTRMEQLPDAHAIAAALAFARQGPDDIGPDVAYCYVLQNDSYRAKVIRLLTDTLCRQSGASRGDMAAAAGAAWDAMIWERSTPRPTNIDQRAWDVILLLACGVLNAAAWDSLAQAERCYTRAA